MSITSRTLGSTLLQCRVQHMHCRPCLAPNSCKIVCSVCSVNANYHVPVTQRRSCVRQAGFKGAGVPASLATLREMVASRLAAPPALVAELAALAADAGLCAGGDWVEDSKQWRSVWSAICQV